MVRSTSLAIVALLQLAPAPTALAQPAIVGLGARVRVTMSETVPVPGRKTARSPTRVEGILVDVTDTVISIRVGGTAGMVTVARQAIISLERSSGYRSRAKKTGLGALIGLGGGALVGLAATCDEGWFCDAGFRALAGGTWGAIAGGVLGAVLPPAPRWVVVPESSLTAATDPASAPAPPRPPTRAALSVGAGVASSGPAADLEDAMRAAQFADSMSGFGRSISHPSSSTGFGTIGTPYWLDARYSVRAPWSVSFQYSRVPIGQTSGFRAPMHFLHVDYEVWTVAGTVAWTRGPVSLGAGPAMFTGRSKELGPGASDWASRSTAGMLAEAVVHLPGRTRFFLDMRAQYRHAGRMTVGPYTPFAWPAGSPAPFPASEVRFNHWFVGVGPGVRF
jgi:hypothetical protein